ncbi:helix-turn-helix transcriptional regulator [Mesorhizobium sp. ANAO-SY3R2]|uniref:helix-turn-helix transcriptional regulator n=1 Tax=Mesorhizobium sp. ANAO-SY3R2 TaxID=3166644 RepID=UPI00366C2851
MDQIYEAALVPERWADVLTGLGRMFGAPAVSLLAFDDTRPIGHSETPLVEAANELFCSSDLWKQSRRLQYSFEKPTTGFVIAQDYYPPGFLDADAGFHLRRDLGLESQAGTVVAMPGGEVVVFVLERPRSDAPFSADDIHQLNQFYPHLARSGLLAARLGLQRAATTVQALEVVGLPAAVLNATGRVLASNSLLDQVQPLFVAKAFGKIALADEGPNALFQQAIEAIRSSAEPVVRSIPVGPRDRTMPTVVHVIPLKRAAHDVFGADVLVIATEVTASRMVPSPALLTGLFDLEPAEAKLAAALAQGKSLKDAAMERGIRYNSARTYLTRILRKTGTRQQSELVALLKSVEAAQVSHTE